MHSLLRKLRERLRIYREFIKYKSLVIDYIKFKENHLKKKGGLE